MRRLGALGPRPAALPALVVLAALAAVAALATVKSFDGDLGFHLATGRAVLALGRVPSTNVLAYTQPEHPWVLQQWLPATLFELAWRAWGAAGPLGVKVAVVVASFACALAAARRLGAATAVAAPVAVLGAWAAAFRFSERPLVFSNLAVAALALVLAGAASSPRRRARLALAAVIVAVACHLHAGAVFLFVLLAATGAGLVVEPLRRRWLKDDHAEGPAGWRPALALAGVAVAGLALAGATLALYHPYGLRVLEVPFTMAGDAYLAEHLVEFRAPWRFPVAYLGAYWALLLAATALVLARVRAVPATWSAPVAAFALLSLRHVRLVDVFALVAVPPVAAALTALAARAGEARARRAGLAALAVLCVAAPLDRWSRATPGVGLDPAVWPLGLFGDARRGGLRGPAFVSDAWAGMWLGLYYPAERAFFDTRFDAYSARFYRDVYQATRYGLPGWDATLDRYGVQLAVLKYTTPNERRYQGGRDNLRQHLARDPRWSLVAFDDAGAVFARRAGVNARQAEGRAIPGVDPDRAVFLGPPRASRGGLAAALARGGRGARLHALAAVAAADAGDAEGARRILARGLARHPGAPILQRAAAALGARP